MNVEKKRGSQAAAAPKSVSGSRNPHQRVKYAEIPVSPTSTPCFKREGGRRATSVSVEQNPGVSDLLTVVHPAPLSDLNLITTTSSHLFWLGPKHHATRLSLRRRANDGGGIGALAVRRVVLTIQIPISLRNVRV